MNTKRYIFASLAVFAFIFIFEWVFHGSFLKGIYDDTAHLWRAKEDCIFWAMLLGQFTFPFIFSLIYSKGIEKKGIGEGIRYGLLIGLLLIPGNFIWYAVMPLPFDLVALWSIGGLLEMGMAGAILAAVYRP